MLNVFHRDGRTIRHFWGSELFYAPADPGRRQPVRIVDGRVEGGYTGVFELICPGCGDNPYVDYSEVPSRLRWLRGPLTLEAALEAYDKHLGPLPSPNGDHRGVREEPR
jgi:hypothetical protein